MRKKVKQKCIMREDNEVPINLLSVKWPYEWWTSSDLNWWTSRSSTLKNGLISSVSAASNLMTPAVFPAFVQSWIMYNNPPLHTSLSYFCSKDVRQLYRDERSTGPRVPLSLYIRSFVVHSFSRPTSAWDRDLCYYLIQLFFRRGSV
jgi:hypothetical protein